MRDTSKLDENRQPGSGGKQTDAAGSVPTKSNEEVTSELESSSVTEEKPRGPSRSHLCREETDFGE